MKILVTGGAGYIGTSLVGKLNKLKGVDEIYVYDNLSQPSLGFFLGETNYDKVNFIQGDILDTYSLEKVISKVDVVFHLAAYVNFPYNHQQNMQYEQINKWGTLNLVRCVNDFPNNIKKFIFLSSASVYGLRNKIDLNQLPQPSNAYGKSKFAAEKYVNLLSSNMEVKIIRAANVFGFNNNLRLDSVINNFIFKSLTVGKILIYGNGEQFRPYASLENLTELLCKRCLSGNNESLTNFAEFNANLNEIKDWLLGLNPELEYTYVNQNIEFEGQFLEGIGKLGDYSEKLRRELETFKQNIRVFN